jgi:hypothetical protein
MLGISGRDVVSGGAMGPSPLQNSWREQQNDKERVLARKIHTATLKDKRIDLAPANFVHIECGAITPDWRICEKL